MCTIGAGSFSPPNGSGTSFWTRSGVDGTSILVPFMCRGSNVIVSTISDKFVYCGRHRGHRRILTERALTDFIAAKKSNSILKKTIFIG